MGEKEEGGGGLWGGEGGSRGSSAFFWRAVPPGASVLVLGARKHGRRNCLT
ncbi:hypothetical protein PABY_04790 [Pyrodictium abyssi]|uniref:Uncharacterized protein n=1 Tax=Pyrodictium abyssi TaxID=54256 RepID=A0ABM8IXR6_9CREN|nr:hypothetical protein PABY_04790 [Pyrodictium abyssi]